MAGDFKIDKAALQRMQDEANRKVQDVIRKVNAEMAGQDVTTVHRTLMSRLKAVGVQPNDSEVRKYAQSISDRTLTE